MIVSMFYRMSKANCERNSVLYNSIYVGITGRYNIYVFGWCRKLNYMDLVLASHFLETSFSSKTHIHWFIYGLHYLHNNTMFIIVFIELAQIKIMSAGLWRHNYPGVSLIDSPLTTCIHKLYRDTTMEYGINMFSTPYCI